MPPATSTPVVSTDLPLGPVIRGKVRDCYRLETAAGPRLLIISTDRISAFDWVLPTPIPDKGKVLTAVSAFWFDWLSRRPEPVPHHLLTTDVDAMGLPPEIDREPLRGRSMLVTAADVVPFECVVRGWLAGSGLSEYQQQGTVCGQPLPPGIPPGGRLAEPIFTPATKATEGHDENVPFAALEAALGPAAELLRSSSLAVYTAAAAFAAERGIVLADTKFEWGYDAAGRLLLVDEVLTPDSSRFWPAAATGQGRVPDSFDKQFVRDWLAGCQWDRTSPPPALPPEIVARTREKYLEVCLQLTGGLPEGVSG
jgi:phosphoribosylaminoimidazole-succinocarboxamide synthase